MEGEDGWEGEGVEGVRSEDAFIGSWSAQCILHRIGRHPSPICAQYVCVCGGGGATL